MNKKLAIIDGKSVFYRGYYAMPTLSTKDGTPTGGIYGFAVMALEVIKRLKPDYVAIAWDKPKTNIRKRLEMYPKYKAGRKPAPDDFYAQIPILHELLAAFGWPLYELDDYEADDIMGTLAVKAAKKGIDVQLVTSDLDVLQLIDPHVHVYALKKGLSNIELFHPESFEAKYGLKPEQFLDLKALKGDSSDNIPGVPGIGEKTAIELLKTYKTLDEIYDNLALIKDSTKTKLEDGKDLAYLSKKIGAIWVDAPVKLDLQATDVNKLDQVALRDILQRLEFRTLLRQLPETMQVHEQATGQQPAGSQPKLKAAKNLIIADNNQLKKLSFKNLQDVVVHGFAAGKHGADPKVIIISPEPSQVYTLDLAKLDSKLVATLLAGLASIVGYDTKSFLKILLGLGQTKLPKVSHDVFIGAFLIDSLRREQTLSELAATDIGYGGSALENISPEELMERASDVAAIIRALHLRQSEMISELTKIILLADQIEWPVIPVLAKMEFTGIKLDGKYLNRFAEELADSISDLEQIIYGYADQEFNIASPQQLAEILFTKLKLPTESIKKGKTGYSTAVSELNKLRDKHPIIDRISQYREVTKLKNTYVDTLPTMTDKNSRIHTTFALTVAQTGRLSSADPNLQNIPVKTELGNNIRKAFVAAPGNVLVSADYSQFELRLAAVLAEDKELIELFNQDVDIHTRTAAEVYGRELEDVTKQMRSAAKTVNFGILYGQGAHGLAATSSMTYAEAKHFIDRYRELRKPLFEYMARVLEQARKKGYVETLFGRRRPMPDILSSNFVVRQAAERQAINMPIQGTEADLMKMAMITIDKKFADWGQQKSENFANQPKMLLQIHDSILVETLEADAKAVAELLQTTMENVYKLPVKLTVDTSIAKNWGEL